MSDGGDGFFSVDALVGVMVLSVTLALTLSAQSVARRLADRALETRRATAAAAYLLEQGRTQGPGFSEGRTADFSWRLNVSGLGREAGAPEGAALCRAVLDLTSARGGRTSRFAAVRPCGDAARG